MRPAPAEACRVLDLGCSDGGNLLPMCDALPDSRFVGVDLSARQIRDGRNMIEALGLRNVQLECRDLVEVDAHFGQFDYIICHGVYSWVPEPVRRRILEICRENLAPQGVAYISYNTLPGWHLRQMLRDILLNHVQHLADPAAQLLAARKMLESLARESPLGGGAPREFLQHEASRLCSRPDAYLYHDYLETENTAFYLRDFLRDARACGLQYLGDQHLTFGWESRVGPEEAAAWSTLADDPLGVEQHLDLLSCQTFRQTLLCHQGIHVDRVPQADIFQELHLSAWLVSVPDEAVVGGDEPVEFQTAYGPSVVLTENLHKAAFLALGRAWPSGLAYRELLDRTRQIVAENDSSAPATSAEAEATLLQVLMESYAAGMIDAQRTPGRFIDHVTRSPKAANLARYQAAQGELLVNRRHWPIKLDGLLRHLLTRLDGSRCVEDLANEFQQMADAGALQLDLGDQPPQSQQQLRARLIEAVRLGLDQLASAAFLIE